MLAKRAYNLREGWQPEDDWLPDRFLAEELTVGSGRTAALTPATLRSMIDGYYAARGLDAALSEGSAIHPWSPAPGAPTGSGSRYLSTKCRGHWESVAVELGN